MYFKKFILIIMIFGLVYHSQAQKHDYNWLLGYGYALNPGDTFGISVMDFNTPSLNPKIYFDSTKRIDFDGASSCMSDKNGKFIFATNSVKIIDATGKTMSNGYDIDPDGNDFASIYPQTSVSIPLNSDSNKYMILHESIILAKGSGAGKPLLSRIVNLNIPNSLGIADKKSKIFYNDTIQPLVMSPVRHANGRDWWLAKPGLLENYFYTFIIRDTNIVLFEKQKIDTALYHSYSQGCFSANGKYYAKVSTGDDSVGTIIDLLQFDRCSGKFAYVKKYEILNSAVAIGCSFSPNSRFLYVSGAKFLYQIDLFSKEKEIFKIDSIDSFVEILGGGFIGYVYFGLMEIGPDGRIYNVPGIFSRMINVIEKPNLLGRACDVKKHLIRLAGLQVTIPNHPNYRLGPIDGSPCDTLGINNIPVAEFRYDQDTSEYKKIEFTNLSWYEPDEYWWDWGDGSAIYYTTVWDTSIIHTYAKEGVYQVCLRAKNINGEHTICKEIKLGTTGINSYDSKIGIEMHPNPAHDIIIINVEDYLPSKMLITIYDIQGKEVLHKRLYQGSNVIDLEDMNAGVYILEIKERGIMVRSEKFVKL
ncbi:MAG: T9SS type A sorting domain-containing protein [Saprospiraceae bacterium]|nr:T9SS type A sorting domain-containing protein [Candidatus Defluviibacterium haderslevense]